MATLPAGINSSIRGTIGNVVGSSWKGKPYIKSKYKKRTKRVSDAELANRKKFAISQAWLKPVLPFVRVGFNKYSQLSEGFVAAKSYLLKHAIEGEGIDLRINPAHVLVSHGDLPLPADIAVEVMADRLQFTWDAHVPPYITAEDQVMVLAYDINKGEAYYTVNGQFRNAGVHELRLYPIPGAEYHLYFAMVAADRNRQSNSVYLGTITL